MKAIRQAETRKILDLYNKEEISYSRMNEMFNELADEFAIEFAEWADENYFKVGNKSIWIEDLDSDIIITSKELLEIFKKEKGL
jgi:hypothetical protein